MPKRLLTHHMAHTAKIRRKSMLIDDPAQYVVNFDGNEDKKNEDEVDRKSTKHMVYIRSNKNNEVERLLLHNSKVLTYHVDHSDFPAFNIGMWPQENCDMLTNYPSCAFSCPRPIFVANKQCEKVDICYKRPISRYYYRNRMRMTRSTYQSALKSNKNIRSCVKDNTYHYSVFEIAERVHMQPDPFFQSSYDFYFTGGNLSALPHQGTIIHAGGEKLQEMLISEFPAADENDEPKYLRNVGSLQNSEDCEIFEYHPLLTSPNSSRKNCFIARQRNLLSINNINDMNQVKTVTQFRTKSTPFISFAQSDRDINNFLITTMKQHIRFYDLGGSAPSLVKLFEISPNEKHISWNSLKPWRENTFLYANEKQFFMVDVRTSPEQWLKEVTLSNNDLICDHISALLPSAFNNLFYVATNHKLQCMDIRHLKKFSLNDSVGGICRWTHQLRYAPLMMDTYRLGQTEFVALSSPIAGDLHICQLSRERNVDKINLEPSFRVPKHIYSSPCLPYQPPTLLEAYQNARLSGNCLRAEANLESRLKCCTTGMKFLDSDNHSNRKIGQLLISNSNGDVFAHTLSKREDNETEERCNKHSDDIMAELENKICREIQLPLNFTEIKNMIGLRKVFLSHALSSVKKFDIDAMDNEYNEGDIAANNTTRGPGKSNPKRLHLGRWQKPLSTLHSYKDALVPNLLSIWDIDIDKEENIRLGSLRRNFKTDPQTKVEDWLKKNTHQNLPMLSIPLNETVRYSDHDASNICDTTLNISQTQHTTDFENAAHSTQILNDSVNISKTLDTTDLMIQVADGTVVDKTKNKKKNKKYVKGF